MSGSIATNTFPGRLSNRIIYNNETISPKIPKPVKKYSVELLRVHGHEQGKEKSC